MSGLDHVGIKINRLNYNLLQNSFGKAYSPSPKSTNVDLLNHSITVSNQNTSNQH